MEGPGFEPTRNVTIPNGFQEHSWFLVRRRCYLRCWRWRLVRQARSSRVYPAGSSNLRIGAEGPFGTSARETIEVARPAEAGFPLGSGPGRGRLSTWARALRELIGAALRAPAEALYLLGSCLDVPPSGSKATRSIGARPATGRTEGHGRHPSYPAACDSPGHSPRVATCSARPLPLAREQPDAHLLIVHPRQPPVKGLASLLEGDKRSAAESMSRALFGG